MAWPNSTNYFEAIQNPALCFHDAELRQGEAATNPMGLPILYAGNFAAVFQVQCPGKQHWAVKCFTREVPGLQQRYQAVSAHLRKARLPFMVDFQYLEQGIKVAGRWYAVLKMRWVEGMPLNELVESALDRPFVLNRMARLWVQMGVQLRNAHIAHGDLQHGNVLLIPGKKEGNVALKLIDYDGMYVPALSASKPGEKGHPNYQHPQRLREGTYHADVDRFSLLVIYTALRCLMVGGKSLWKPAYNNQENLLFREEDFRDPGRSALLRELWQLADRDAHALVGHLTLAAQQPLEQTPLLDRLVRGEQVRPLTAREEEQVVSLLGPYRGAAPLGAARQGRRPLQALADGWQALRQRLGSGWRRWLFWAAAGSAGLLLLLFLTLFPLGDRSSEGSGSGPKVLSGQLPDLPAGKVASYRDQFQGPRPAPGWSYLWNKNAPVDNTKGLVPLRWDGKSAYTTDGQATLPRPDPGAYLFLSREGGHPGRGAQQAKIDRYAVAAYQLQPGDGPAFFRLTHSRISTRGEVEVRVSINGQPPLVAKVVTSKQPPVSFDSELGTLHPGETIYVQIGPKGNDGNDTFESFDFAITRGRATTGNASESAAAWFIPASRALPASGAAFLSPFRISCCHDFR